MCAEVSTNHNVKFTLGGFESSVPTNQILKIDVDKILDWAVREQRFSITNNTYEVIK